MALTDLLKTFNEEKAIVPTEEGKYVEKDTYGVSLKGVLQRGRLKLKREAKPRPQGVSFRPSTITFSYCRRAKIGQLAGVLTLYDFKAAPRQQVVFDMGNAIHDIVQGYFWDIGLLKGSYYCLKCDKVYHDLVAPVSCPSGKSTHKRRHLRYNEVTISDEEYLIRGRCDGILVIDGEEHVMDIKSVHNRTLGMSEMAFCFEDLDTQGPKQDHVVQLNLYMHIMGIHRGHLLYMAKNNGQIKTFAIPYNPAVLEPYFNEIKWLREQADKLKNGETAELPAPCGNEDCLCHTILKKLPK